MYVNWDAALAPSTQPAPLNPDPKVSSEECPTTGVVRIAVCDGKIIIYFLVVQQMNKN